MSEKYTIEDVAGIIECEGLGYAIQHYLGADKIEDPELAEKWEQAANLLNWIDNRTQV